MPVSRRAFLGTSGAIGAGTLLAGSLGTQTAAADPIAAVGNPVPRPAARNSLRMRTGQPGLQWVTYGYNLPNNANIPEDVWKKNIDWVIREFAPYGYDTICTDGWIESSQRVDKNGYIVSQNDEWTHDFPYWIDYLAGYNMKLSIYYNPFWITESARQDRSITVKGRPDVAVADLTADWDPFTKDKIYWVDPHRDGAKEYVQGYVQHFKAMGVPRLRVDFLAWFETGWDQNIGVVMREHGRESYETLLDWIDEAAGKDMVVSLVMPSMSNHGELERSRGDSFRINDDADKGGWGRLSGGRQDWRPYWTQWSNPFTGLTGWADVNGPGLIGLDADFLIASSYATDDERRTTVGLFTIAGSPICISDTVDTIGDNAWAFQNPEVIALNKDGLAGKPLFNNNHGFNWDTSSRDTERWIGQLSDGSWIVGLFNRGDAPNTRAIDFAKDLGITDPVKVRDLWARRDLGTKTSYSAGLPTHGSALLKITPTEGPVRYDSTVAGWSLGAVFDNETAGYTARGYATNLDKKDATVSFAVTGGGTGGTRTVQLRYATATGRGADVQVTVTSGSKVARTARYRLNLPGTNGAWKTASVRVDLVKGRNLLKVVGTGAAAPVHLDYITIEGGPSPKVATH